MFSSFFKCSGHQFAPNNAIPGQACRVVDMCLDMGLTSTQVDILHEYFEKYSSDNNSYINFAKVLSANQLEVSPILLALPHLHGNSPHTGYCHFQTWVILLFNLLSLDKEQTTRFLICLFDISQLDYLSREEVQYIFRCVWGDRYNTDKFIGTNIDRMPFTKIGTVTINEAIESILLFPILMAQIFKFQTKLRKRIGGNYFWSRISKMRAQRHKDKSIFVICSGYVESTNTVNFFDVLNAKIKLPKGMDYQLVQLKLQSDKSGMSQKLKIKTILPSGSSKSTKAFDSTLSVDVVNQFKSPKNDSTSSLPGGGVTLKDIPKRLSVSGSRGARRRSSVSAISDLSSDLGDTQALAATNPTGLIANIMNNYHTKVYTGRNNSSIVLPNLPTSPLPRDADASPFGSMSNQNSGLSTFRSSKGSSKVSKGNSVSIVVASGSSKYSGGRLPRLPGTPPTLTLPDISPVKQLGRGNNHDFSNEINNSVNNSLRAATTRRIDNV